MISINLLKSILKITIKFNYYKPAPNVPISKYVYILNVELLQGFSKCNSILNYFEISL